MHFGACVRRLVVPGEPDRGRRTARTNSAYWLARHHIDSVLAVPLAASNVSWRCWTGSRRAAGELLRP